MAESDRIVTSIVMYHQASGDDVVSRPMMVAMGNC